MSEPSLKVLYIFLDSVLENTSVANLASHWISLLFHTNPLGIQFLWQSCTFPLTLHTLPGSHSFLAKCLPSTMGLVT